MLFSAMPTCSLRYLAHNEPIKEVSGLRRMVGRFFIAEKPIYMLCGLFLQKLGAITMIFTQEIYPFKVKIIPGLTVLKILVVIVIIGLLAV